MRGAPELHDDEHTFSVSTRLKEEPDHFSATLTQRRRRRKITYKRADALTDIPNKSKRQKLGGIKTTKKDTNLQLFFLENDNRN